MLALIGFLAFVLIVRVMHRLFGGISAELQSDDVEHLIQRGRLDHICDLIVTWDGENRIFLKPLHTRRNRLL
jgi:hypothetical protein